MHLLTGSEKVCLIFIYIERSAAGLLFNEIQFFFFALRIISMELISMAASIRAQISRFTNAIIACNIIDCIVCSLKDRRTTAARGLGSYSPHMREINVVDKHVIHHHSPSSTLCSKISVWFHR